MRISHFARSPQGVHIRQATLADHGELAVLFGQLDTFHSDRAPWLFRKAAACHRSRSYLRTLLADPASGVLVADASVCVGVAVVHLHEAPEVPVFVRRKRTVIDRIVIHPDWRRRGIGRKLYEGCEAWAKEHHTDWIELNVYEFNEPAQRFYAALGFETVMRRMCRLVHAGGG